MPASTRRSSEQVARQVLETADRLFYGQGVRATGVNQIIAEAEVAKASFYAHFPSKDDLVVAYLEHRHVRWFEMFHEVVDAARSSRGRLLAAFTFLGRWQPSVGYRGCAFLNAIGEGSTSEPVARVVASHKAQLRAFFQTAAVAVTTTKARARGLGDHLLLLFEGAIIQSSVHRDAWPLRAAAKAASDLVPADGA